MVLRSFSKKEDYGSSQTEPEPTKNPDSGFVLQLPLLSATLSEIWAAKFPVFEVNIET